MAGIDTAAIAFTLAIVAIGVGFTFYMSDVQDNATPVVRAPNVSTETSEQEATTSSGFGADLAEKIKAEAAAKEAKKTVEMEEEVMMEKPMMKETHEEEVMMEKPAGPQTHTVEVPAGTSVPGCEETNSCYLPANITINAGDTVEWPNVDTAAHTVTSGSPADGPSGVFDSSLLMADATFAFTFEDAGEYDYFCMVHPWMVGSVSVTEGSIMEETHEEEVMMEKPAGPQTHTVEVPAGTSVPGCEETNSCYLPANITINAGDTVEWPNVDTAAHTVTSGSPADGPSGVFDSSLLMADATFAFTFEDAGEYDYFCMVHPWMVGSVSVN